MLVSEREEGTLPRLITMPVSKVSIMLGKLAGIFVVGVAQIALLILAGVFLFGVSWGQSLAALTLVVLSFALAATSLGALLAAFTRTAAQATALDNIIVLSFSALGGTWWPLEIVPKWMQVLAHALPTAWAMDAFHDIITRGLSVEAVLPEVGALLGFAAVFFTIGIWRFRYIEG
jgi:ABC-2 type transport system permease protein